MYFESTRRTTYRFPSTNSVQNLDSRYYFPEKPHASGDSSRHETQFTNRVPERENFYDIY